MLGPEAYFEAVQIANAKSSSSFPAAGKQQVSTRRKKKPTSLHKRSVIVRDDMLTMPILLYNPCVYHDYYGND